MISKKLKTAGLLGLILVFAVTLAACDMGSTTSGTVEMDELNVNISGEGEVEPDQGEFDENASIEITAEPAEGWKFSHWEGNVAEEEAKSTVLMKGEREVTAVFNWDYSHLVEDGEVMSPGNKGRGRNILVVVNGRAQGRGVAYSSIQEAVDNAEEGYKILVTPGTYEETVEVETDDLTIKGVNEHNMPILTGDLYIFSEDVQVYNLEVKGDIIEAALVNNAEELEAALEDEKISTIIVAEETIIEPDSTVLIDRSGVTLKAENKNATIQGEGDLIRIEADEVTIDGFSILEDPNNAYRAGIVPGGQDITIQNNIFEGFNNHIAWDRAGGLDPKNTTIKYNEFRNVGFGDAQDGSAVAQTEGVSGIFIIENEFYNNRNDIGLAFDATNVTIEGNDFIAGDSDRYISNRNLGDPESEDILALNTFDPEAVIANLDADDREDIVTAPGEGEALNINTRDRFDGADAIKDAIENANEDHTILVGAGTYNEDLTVNVEGLTLESVEKHGAVIEGIIDVSKDVTIDGFEVEANVGSEGNAIFAQGGVKFELLNSKVTAITDDPGTPGIVYIEGGWNEIGDLSNPNQVTLKNNEFIGEDLAGGVGVGMEIDEATIENNDFNIESTHAALEIWTDGEGTTFNIDDENTFEELDGDEILIDLDAYESANLPIDQDDHF